MSLDGLRPDRATRSQRRTPQVWQGVILDTAESLQDELRVRIPAFKDSRRFFGPMPFVPGVVMPQEGDTCAVVFDENRQGVIVWWSTALEASASPTGPAGGVLGGEYPDPDFAVDMATQAELDAVKLRRSIIDAEGTRTNVAYGALSNGPDVVPDVVVASGEVLVVMFTALVKSSVAGAGRAAIFFDDVQLKGMRGTGAPVVQEVSFGTNANDYDWLFTDEDAGGVSTIGGSGNASSVSTGMGLCSEIIFEIAPGTYDVSVRGRSTSGSITWKERKLRAGVR